MLAHWRCVSLCPPLGLRYEGTDRTGEHHPALNIEAAQTHTNTYVGVGNGSRYQGIHVSTRKPAPPEAVHYQRPMSAGVSSDQVWSMDPAKPMTIRFDQVQCTASSTHSTAHTHTQTRHTAHTPLWGIVFVCSPSPHGCRRVRIHCLDANRLFVCMCVCVCILYMRDCGIFPYNNTAPGLQQLTLSFVTHNCIYVCIYITCAVPIRSSSTIRSHRCAHAQRMKEQGNQGSYNISMLIYI